MSYDNQLVYWNLSCAVDYFILRENTDNLNVTKNLVTVNEKICMNIV